jgi:serine/threonine protein kinase
MQEHSVNQLVGQVIQNYRVEHLVRQGRLHALYLARDVESQRLDTMTVYVIPNRFTPEVQQRFLVRFLKEAATIRTLQHRNILPLYTSSEYAGYPYLVTPYLIGGSLSDGIKQRGSYSPTEALPILEAVAAGIAFAHSRGHIHGTLRPSNILVGNDGSTVCVANFGLMQMLQKNGMEYDSRPYAHLLSIADEYMVAPEYAAPEMLRGQSVDTRVDIYALGAIAFELLCGKPPLTGATIQDIATQQSNGRIPSLQAYSPSVSVALDAVVKQALENDPDRRFQRVSEFVEAFAQGTRGIIGQRSSSAETSPVENTHPGSMTHQSTRSWQLTPPIVTGRMKAMPSPQALAGSQIAPTGGPIPSPSQKLRSPQFPMGNAVPPVHASNQQQPFDCKPTSGPLQVNLNASAPLANLPQSTPEMSLAQSRLPVGNSENEPWDSQPLTSQSEPTSRQLAKERSKRVRRRQAVLILATGSIVAAGGAAALHLLHIGSGKPMPKSK